MHAKILSFFVKFEDTFTCMRLSFENVKLLIFNSLMNKVLKQPDTL